MFVIAIWGPELVNMVLFCLYDTMESKEKVETNMGEGCDVNVLMLLGKTLNLFLFKNNLKFNRLIIVYLFQSQKS